MAASKRNSTSSLALRIAVIDPPPNIMWALQFGKEEIVKPTSQTKSRISFDFIVELAEGGKRGFRLRGPAVQGRPGERFVYSRMGAYAGQVGINAGWRAKISLEGITADHLHRLKGTRAGVLEAKFLGTGRKSGPACATVQLLGEGWHVAGA